MQHIFCISAILLVLLIKNVKFWSVDGSPTTSDAQLEGIKSWCSDDKKHCKCANPRIPKSRMGYRTWSKAHSNNILQCKEVAKTNKTLDVVFLGDSITEGWMGTSLGVDYPKKKRQFTRISI